MSPRLDEEVSGLNGEFDPVGNGAREPVAASADAEGLEPAIREIGMRLLEAMPSPTHSPRLLLEERLMHRLASEPETRAALFRLVDVAPMCGTWRELGEHFAALIDEVDEPPGPARVAGRLGSGKATGPAVGAVAAGAVRAMAHRFIVGADVGDAAGELRRLWQHGVASTVDLLGEATVNDPEADAYAERCRSALDALAAQARGWSGQGPVAPDRHGRPARANLSIKVSALTPHARSEAPARGADSARRRLRELLRHADRLGAHLHIDMESLDLRETVTALVRGVLSEPEFARGPSAGIVLQAYLRDSGDELESWLEWAAAERLGQPLTIRLVKGAYWDQEVVEAREAGWDVPVYEDRAECDRNFEALSRRLIGAADLVRPAVGSHNVRSVAHAIAAAEALGAGDVLELQVLRGLGDDLQSALAELGLRVRTYCPVGDLVAGMAYLVRRLLENTSNDSFLRIRTTAEDPATLLAAP